VILVSSEHTFPFKLNDRKFGFNVLDLSRQVVYAGEVPPGEMYHLLTKRWSVPHDVAIALISTFGGHILDTIEALRDLSHGVKNGNGPVAIRLDPQMSSAVRRCLKWEGSGPDDQPRMRAALRALAETGFFPLDDDADPVAEVLCSNGVAGLVCASSPLIVGLDPEVWSDDDIEYGLVPCKQSMRLAIARFL
jgi:hypothetical protein